MKITVTTVDQAQRKPIPGPNVELGFGKFFSDHMFLYGYSPTEGWHNARIVPYGPLDLDPACMVLHYGQECFEGLKAYYDVNGGIRLFRYRKNLERLNASAQRLCMPSFSVDEVGEGLRQLILKDREWIPRKDGTSLYIRPNYIAYDPFLGVRASNTYLLYIICGPVGCYYPEGVNPVKIYVNENQVRAVRGGTGQAKTGGNYAASLLGQQDAKRKGYAQVLWLDAIERKFVEEVGTMNIFFVIGDEIVTSPLTGSILPGVTRDSVIQICKRWGLNINERMLSIDEVVKAAAKGTLREIFGTGTAAVIAPVSHFCYQEKEYRVADGKIGALSKKIYDHILAIQYGREEDVYGWTERIDL